MGVKTILLVIPNVGAGGAQKVFMQQLIFFRQHFHVIGCTFNWDGAFATDRQPEMISLDVPGGGHVASKAFRFRQRVARLRKIKRDHRVDVCISHLEGADYVNILSRGNEKTICWVHGTKLHDGEIAGGLGWIRKKWMMPVLYNKATKIVTVGEAIRLELIGPLGIDTNRVTSLPNGIALQSIHEKGKTPVGFFQSLFAEGKPVMVTHCRLARQKNVQGMVRIFALLKSTIDAKLLIIGDGDLRSELMSLCKELDLSVVTPEKSSPVTGDVYFTFHLDNPFPFLQRSTLYLATSFWEGFPLALCEALACGLPVVAADCFTGPREIIAPTTDVLRPTPTPQFSNFGVLMPMAENSSQYLVWAETVALLLRDAGLLSSMSTSATERANDFDQSRIDRAWLSLIKSVE